MLLANLVHALPFQCRIVPALPTAQTSVGELPHTALRSFDVPLVTFAQAVPFHRTMVPPEPTAQAAVGEPAETP